MTGLDVGGAARAAGTALRMTQAASNPLVAVKHGRREDRAVVYDRFIALCVVFCCNSDREDDEAPARVDDLYGALQAIELRAPRHVREAAQKLFWSIVGRPEELGLIPFWITVTTPREYFGPARRDESHVDEEGWTEEQQTEAWENRQKSLRRRLLAPWRFSPLPDAHPGPASGTAEARFSSIFEFLEGVAEFTNTARVDVNNRWRWWHWPLTLIPPLKRWQLTR